LISYLWHRIYWDKKY